MPLDTESKMQIPVHYACHTSDSTLWRTNAALRVDLADSISAAVIGMPEAACVEADAVQTLNIGVSTATTVSFVVEQAPPT